MVQDEVSQAPGRSTVSKNNEAAQPPRKEDGAVASASRREDSAGFEYKRRLPSPLVEISGIKSTDIRISVIGTVIGRADDGIVVDDGTGKIDVTLEGSSNDVPERVRVMGRVVPTESGFHLQGEVVQDMSGLDMDLLKKTMSLEAG
jgi:hypothetical protein